MNIISLIAGLILIFASVALMLYAVSMTRTDDYKLAIKASERGDHPSGTPSWYYRYGFLIHVGIVLTLVVIATIKAMFVV